MTDRDDDGLRGRFHDLAVEDEAAAPRFLIPESPPRGRWPVTRLAFAAAAVLAVAGAAGYAWRVSRHEPPYPIDLGAVAWNGPTDFLLDTPGASLLRELPRIGPAGPALPEPGISDDTSRRNRS